MTVVSQRTLLGSLACLAITAALASTVSAPAKDPAPAMRLGDFSLLDHQGVFHQVSRYRHKKALVLMAYDAGCASDGQALDALNKVRQEFESRDVAFALLNSTTNQDRSAVRALAEHNNITLPILMDHAQLVAESLNLRTSGSVVALDPEGPKLLYKGPMQAQLSDALNAKLAGNTVTAKILPVQGCALDFPAKKKHAASPPDYTKDIAPIVAKNCAVCHHEGGIGPFPLNGYTAVKGWSPMIREVLMTKRMPPMQVDPHIGRFSNARYISDADLQTLVHWIDLGSPRGTGKDDPLTKLSFGKRTDWQLGPPDFVVTANTHEIPATGVLDYINDVIDLEFNEDKWVRAVQFIPGDPAVLHHLLTYVTGPNQEGFAGGEATQSNVATRFLEGYAPGKTEAMMFPENTGVYIPKGHKLTMQFHYTTNGKATSDTTVVGLYFHKTPPKYEYLNRSISGPFKIPPYARDYKAAGHMVLREDIMVYGLRAHMHFRGHDMKFSAELPDGTLKELLSVPNYSYAWQPTYQLVEPVKLPAGSRLLVTGSFDNSPYNPANPDPSKELTFGLQSWDEMFIGYWSYTSLKPTH